MLRLVLTIESGDAAFAEDIADYAVDLYEHCGKPAETRIYDTNGNRCGNLTVQGLE